MPAFTSIALGTMAAGSAIGGVASAVGQDTDMVQSPFERRFELDPASQTEQGFFGAAQQGFQGLQDLTAAGPGIGDVRAGVGAQRGFADQLQQASQDGLLPTQQDITRTSGLAGQLLRPEQVAMQQAFGRQSVEASRQAGQLGRSVGDPILQAKMRAAQMEQQERFGARQTSLGTQLAMLQPEQRLGLSRERASVLGGLGSQAMQNRAFLTQMGQSLGEAERSFRERTATQKGFNSQAVQSTNTAGAIGAGLSGGIAGLGAGMGMMGAFGGAGGGTGGGGIPGAMTIGGGIPAAQTGNFATPFSQQQSFIPATPGANVNSGFGPTSRNPMGGQISYLGGSGGRMM